MQKMKSIINNHSVKVLSNTTEIKEKYNCRNKRNCPLDRKCLAPNIIYEAKFTSNQPNYKEQLYTGTVETDFQNRFNNQTKSFNIKQHENDTDTELSKEYWTMKHDNFTPKVLQNNNKIHTFQHNQKKILSVS